MSQLDLDPIIARLKAATPGPWMACDEKKVFDNWPVCPSLGADDEGKCWAVSTDGVRASEMLSGGAMEDAEFIAHARQDIPALISEVLRLRGAL